MADRRGDAVGRSGNANRDKGHVPGEAGLWFFILGDMLLEFGTIFGYFLYSRAADPVVFAQSRATLSQSLGLFNTLLLLTSSLCVALAIQALRNDLRANAARFIVWARALGIGFVAIKAIEYGTEFAAGHTPVTNAFYMYYFAATGLHLVHVLIGIALLTHVANGARHARPRANELRTAETAATFWHMIDLVWIILFPLLYLVS